jgi:hypothetical protein
MENAVGTMLTKSADLHPVDVNVSSLAVVVVVAVSADSGAEVIVSSHQCGGPEGCTEKCVTE